MSVPESGSETVERVIKRAGKAKARADSWHDQYEDAYSMCLPDRNLITKYARGERTVDRVFDSTGIEAIYHFANELQQALTPPEYHWVRFVPGAGVPEEDRDDVARELEGWTYVFHEALRNSNFQSVVHEAYLDLAIGTGAIRVRPGRVTALHFDALPLAKLAIDEGPHGTVQNVYREWSLPLELVPRTWPGATIPPDLQPRLADKPDEPVEVLDVCWYDDKYRIYRNLVIFEKSRHLAYEDAALDSEWAVFRWAVRSGETHGRGPALVALPDIKTLNRLVQLIMANAAMAVSGSFTGIDDGVLNPYNTRFGPGAIIPVRDHDSLRPLQASHQFDVSMIQMERLQKRIEAFFLKDDFGPVDSPTKSATEILLRNERLVKKIGGAFGRLQREMISPLVRKVVLVLQEQEILPPELSVNGTAVDIQFTGPLAQAQYAEEVRSTRELIQMIAETGGAEALAIAMKIEQLPAFFASRLGAPMTLVRSEDEVSAMKDELAAQAAAAQAGGSTPAPAGMPAPAGPVPTGSGQAPPGVM